MRVSLARKRCHNSNQSMDVSCTNCGYTEIYKGSTSTLSNVFDLFTN